MGTRGELLRIVTYNVHKCKGIDGRVRPSRIVGVLREIDPDVVALQEVVSVEDGRPDEHQASYIATQLGYHYTIGENRRISGAIYGNVVLSRHPLACVRNHDISVRGRERRGCLHTDVQLPAGETLHVFNVHLGTSFLERRHQGRRLIDYEILSNKELRGPRIMLGDFNEWTPGLTSRLLAAHLKSVDVRDRLRRSTTFPGVFPFLSLDHIYYDDRLRLDGLTVHRSRLALVASDHLPLVADFRLPAEEAKAGKATGSRVSASSSS
ncbi:MAG TPA: endonuclease/exonuclease/phosphatase family protein [Vicinamibacteria bacterium]|jgi:endonuclease/exonuclease/phosphatase family metal-dependent hydrolase|nr:endonuclease/exonuclease/phosphatase family protein [Vicinamibacteria bacterium]